MWRLTTILITLIPCSAFAQFSGSGFSLPKELDGFNKIANILPKDSPMRSMILEHPGICDDVGVYYYKDGKMATAGLGTYLKHMDMTFKELQRTKLNVLWSAKSGSVELLGVWRADPEGDGTLELCGQGQEPRRYSSSTSGVGGIGGYGFGGFGGLGLIMWYLRRRLSR